MKMKKSFLTVCIVVLAFGLMFSLSSCQKKAEETGAAPGVTETTGAAPAPEAAPAAPAPEASPAPAPGAEAPAAPAPTGTEVPAPPKQ